LSRADAPVPVAFDLDGTLIDSAPDLHAAACRMLAEAGLPAIRAEQTRAFIGNGVPKLVERVMGAVGLAPDSARHAHLTERFLHHYEAAPADKTRLYPGVRAALERLSAAGHPLAICTNKPERPARRILAAFGLSDHFAAVVGGDTLDVKKPDPAPLHHALAGSGRTAALYVGDSETDAETSRAAGIPFLLFTEGYRKSPVTAIAHDAAFADFLHLPDLVSARAAALQAPAPRR